MPTVAIVSGRPGAGKTTLGRALALDLRCPLVSRDEINQGILHTFANSELMTKEWITKLAFDAFFRVIELLILSGTTLVAEAAFQDYRWRLGLDRLIPIANLRIIQCVVDPELAIQRVNSRTRYGFRSGVGAENTVQSVNSFKDLSLPVPSLRVATADGYDPPIKEIMKFLISDCT
jgi:predicted kinase